jgi:hypothetical protein
MLPGISSISVVTPIASSLTEKVNDKSSMLPFDSECGKGILKKK